MPELSNEDKGLIRDFNQALEDEIAALKRGRGGSGVTVHDGRFVRREGPVFVYVFSTESPLMVMDDAPAGVEIGGQTFSGQIVSVRESEVAVGVEHDCGKSITEARLITNLWYLVEVLRKRDKEVLDGERSFDTRLPQRVSGFAAARVGREEGELGLPASTTPPDSDQQEAIRKALASDVSFVWGPPGTGKTTTIGFLLAALVNRRLRVLMSQREGQSTEHLRRLLFARTCEELIELHNVVINPFPIEKRNGRVRSPRQSGHTNPGVSST